MFGGISVLYQLLNNKGSIMKNILYVCSLLTVFISVNCFSSEIAPLEKALTLAQFEKVDQEHTLLVLEDNGDSVIGIDISAISKNFSKNRFDLVQQLGYETLRNYAKSDLPKISVSYEALLPLSGGFNHHIGAGINYPEHGEETGQKTEPFLFPKIVQSTGSRTSIRVHPNQLLDYEVELCARFSRDIKQVEEIKTGMVGFFVCGDFTDRAQLMRLIDTSNPQSGIGFTDAKSQLGYFPTGPYLVVPRNWKSMLAEIQLKLSVNKITKQNSPASKMILSVDELATKALESGSEPRWRFKNLATTLLVGKTLKKEATILTGTPEGVIFRPPSGGYKFRKVVRYIFTGSFFKSGAKQYVIEQYINELVSQNKYLQPNDLVELNATYLGNIIVKISSSSNTIN